MRKGKDPDPGGPKTSGSGSPTLFFRVLDFEIRLRIQEQMKKL
jgi:hypothetical protein